MLESKLGRRGRVEGKLEAIVVILRAEVQHRRDRAHPGELEPKVPPGSGSRPRR